MTTIGYGDITPVTASKHFYILKYFLELFS